MYIILLTIKEKEVTITLKKEQEKVDTKNWQDENNLSEKFFPALDTLLQKNNLSIENIGDFQLENDIPSGYTTARIARTIITSLNFAHKM